MSNMSQNADLEAPPKVASPEPQNVIDDAEYRKALRETNEFEKKFVNFVTSIHIYITNLLQKNRFYTCFSDPIVWLYATTIVFLIGAIAFIAEGGGDLGPINDTIRYFELGLPAPRDFYYP